MSGKVIVTCSLPMDAGNTKLVVANTSSGAEELTKKVLRAQVVSAFNTIPSEVLFGVFEAKRKKTRPSLVYCGDDRSAKDVAAKLIRDMGFDPGAINERDIRIWKSKELARKLLPRDR